MRQLKGNYFWVLTILILSSTVFNLIWRDKSWPGYYTLSIFLVLIVLNIIWNRYGKNESTKRNAPHHRFVAFLFTFATSG